MSDSQRSREVSLQPAWQQTGNSGYKRLNALGCVILEDLEVDVVYTEGTINADLVKAYLEALEPKLSFEKLHLFVDNASFHKALEGESFDKIELHFLPTYSPNLNLFERIWGFSKKELLDNQFYATFPEFHEAFCTFFCDINSRKEELRSLLTEKFHIIK